MPTREYPNPEPSGKCQDGAVRLHNQMIGSYGVSNLGCYNPNSNMSGGGPSWHVHGEAIDCGANWYDAAGRAAGDATFDWIVAHKEELNLQQCIWATRIYDVSYNEVRGYGGTDHHNHVHAALGHHAAAHWTPTGGGDDLDATEHAWLADLHAFMSMSKNNDTNLPMIHDLWKNVFQGVGSGMFTGEFRSDWEALFEHLGMRSAPTLVEPTAEQLAAHEADIAAARSTRRDDDDG